LFSFLESAISYLQRHQAEVQEIIANVNEGVSALNKEASVDITTTKEVGSGNLGMLLARK